MFYEFTALTQFHHIFEARETEIFPFSFTAAEISIKLTVILFSY